MTRTTTLQVLTLALVVILGCCQGGRCDPAATQAPAAPSAPSREQTAGISKDEGPEHYR